MATQLFLRRGQFRSQEPTFAAVRVDAIDSDVGSALRTINYLAGTAELLRGRMGALSAAAEQLLADVDWGRDRIERDAVADNIPPEWINYARGLGERGVRMRPDHMLPTPWVDHRARLVRSIGADIERLTTMASACAVRAYRSGAAGALDEAAIPDQLEHNMRAIWACAARTAEAIGADSDECRQLWHVPQDRWRSDIGLHLNTEPAEFNRRWSVYTDPDVAAHVGAFVENLSLYAELASRPGSPADSHTGMRPPMPSVWLTAAVRALKAALDTSSADAHTGDDLVLDAVENTEPEWEPQPDTAMEQDGSFPPSTNDHGPDP
ncbi:hypothetical protein [Nocardia iowensis]|uniref:DUF222 domain-containing protein n=1 Tax=Nocardia iowensis TaxID=204891 RepID=A0ABX8RYE7_NOCIO|nr:hypothetical protein [Nocardia iowensis]QXN94588.1 hypothetical protein KV110_16970 [Nocardia iowensis]